MRVDTHSLASSIVISVFFIVSFVFISLIVIMSLRYGGNNDGEWDAQRADDARGS